MFLEEISDDYLICLYRENNDEAKKELCDRYTSFIYGVIVSIQKKMGGYLDFEECFQEGFLSFLKCIERYDNELGAFYYFVKTTVEKKLLCKLEMTKRNSNYIPLDKYVYEGGDETLISVHKPSLTMRSFLACNADCKRYNSYCSSSFSLLAKRAQNKLFSRIRALLRITWFT